MARSLLVCVRLLHRLDRLWILYSLVNSLLYGNIFYFNILLLSQVLGLSQCHLVLLLGLAGLQVGVDLNRLLIEHRAPRLMLIFNIVQLPTILLELNLDFLP